MLKSFENKLKILALVLCSFYGCAWRDEVIRIDNKKAPILFVNPRKRINISLKVDNKILDEQSINRRKDGIKKNGPGWETASIFFEPDGSEILRNAFITELNNKRFNVIYNENSFIKVEILLNQLFIEPYIENYKMSLISVIDVDVIVKINNRIYIRRFKSIRNNNSMELNYKNSIENHIDSFTSQVVLEVDDLIKIKYSKKN